MLEGVDNSILTEMSLQLYGVLLIILIVFSLFYYLYNRISIPRRVRKSKYNLMEITINDIDNMENKGSDFEDYLFVLFSALGYKNTYQTKSSGDFGADLIFTDSNGNRTVVQAKNYADNKPLGNDAIQESFGAMPYFKAAKAVVITTTSRISRPCEIHAAACEIKIITRSNFKSIIKYFKKGLHSEARKIIEGEYKKIEYTPKDRFKNDTIHSSKKIISGDYYYIIPERKKNTG
ncbi:restriction endonuclease [Evansella sp. AB-P1]|uniref:restriction endonuclease n=1 Tax=Evansella sp. AB-P1 TaxID=3037653 RepID=UPI00241E2FDE|nr:restriction endonuclease [Evansella sp. AB-P1]MDG5787807.1 restriction endonuclease [Evansella sp. AB-P1]